WVIEPIYKQALSFDNGLACVTVPGKKRHGTKGFINSRGEMVIEPRFHRQSSFWHREWALVGFENRDAIIDRKGNVIWEQARSEMERS
ncbi:MAG TPA: WG repeat-containing protein, partial [Candidatus Kapabacteria bacterium]|nr:WG repeat-containing protein [Candidatus Kapabacteria bacterium]